VGRHQRHLLHEFDESALTSLALVNPCPYDRESRTEQAFLGLADREHFDIAFALRRSDSSSTVSGHCRCSVRGTPATLPCSAQIQPVRTCLKNNILLSNSAAIRPQIMTVLIARRTHAQPTGRVLDQPVVVWLADGLFVAIEWVTLAHHNKQPRSHHHSLATITNPMTFRPLSGLQPSSAHYKHRSSRITSI
jgi:hypothetical protein